MKHLHFVFSFFAVLFLNVFTAQSTQAAPYRVDLCNLIAYNQKTADVMIDAEEMRLEFFSKRPSTTGSKDAALETFFPHPLSLKSQLKEKLSSSESLLMEVTYTRDHQHLEDFKATIVLRKKNKNFITSFEGHEFPMSWNTSFSAFGNDYHLNCYLSQLE